MLFVILELVVSCLVSYLTTGSQVQRYSDDVFWGLINPKSDYIRQIRGVLLFLASGGYLADSFASYLLPKHKSYQEIFLLIVLVPRIIGELNESS